MIFKTLFQPKHQHKKPSVRMGAIEQLSITEPEDKSILHELAFNDEDVKVRLCALEKLDSFTLWWKLSETSKNEKIKRKAFKIVSDILLDPESSKLSPSEKQSFIRECQHNALLESLIQDPAFQQDTDSVLDVLTRLNKPHLNTRLMFDTKNTGLQLKLLTDISDPAVLNKALKKLEGEDVQSIIDHKLEQIRLKKEKPTEVNKELSLLLSRMLALTECHDYQLLQSRNQGLNDAYQKLTQQFDWLESEKREIAEQKYADIQQRLNNLQEKLQPQWQAEQEQVRRQQHSDDVYRQVEQNLQQLDQALMAGPELMNDSQIQSLEQGIKVSISLVSELDGSHIKQSRLSQLQEGINVLKGLPEFKQRLVSAKALLDGFSEQSLPTNIEELGSAHQYLQQVKGEWKTLRDGFVAFWPKPLQGQWQTQVSSWSQQIKSLRNESDRHFRHCRNKIRQVNELVQQGKFHAAIGLYRKVQSCYEALTTEQQSHLSRPVQGAQEQVENLKDWQAYIAQPRKPAMLEEIKALADSPLAIERQAEQVKHLRQQWNSLGRVESEEDDILNQAFDKQCELAFAPCRAFYAQQEQQRENNLILKQGLLLELQALDQKDADISELTRQFRRLQQQWRAVGEIHYKQHGKLSKEYNKVCEPLKQKVQAFYEHNSEQKECLIQRAKGLLEQEDIRQATEEAKSLQQQWKTIGYAGKQDNSQWQTFRQLNDQLFAGKQKADQQFKQESEDRKKQLVSLLDNIESSLHETQDKSELLQVVDSARQEVETLMEAIPRQEIQPLKNQWKKVLEVQQNKLDHHKQAVARQKYQQVFDVLKQWTGDELPEEVSTLPNQWRQCFEPQTCQYQRLELTLLMEILSGVLPRDEEQALRQTLQLQMMASKLTEGESFSLDGLLKQWIHQGPLTTDDLLLLQRIEEVYALKA